MATHHFRNVRFRSAKVLFWSKTKQSSLSKTRQSSLSKTKQSSLSTTKQSSLSKTKQSHFSYLYTYHYIIMSLHYHHFIISHHQDIVVIPTQEKTPKFQNFTRHFLANSADRPGICANHNPIRKNPGTIGWIRQKVAGQFFLCFSPSFSEKLRTAQKSRG